jgi:ribosomal protein L30/L7E
LLGIRNTRNLLQAGSWAEEFANFEAFDKARKTDNHVQEAWDQGLVVYIEAHNQGETRWRKRSTDGQRRAGKSPADMLNDLRQTRKQVTTEDSHEIKGMIDMVKMTVARYRETHAQRSPEDDGHRPTLMEIDGQIQLGIVIRTTPLGENKVQVAHTQKWTLQELVSDGSSVVRDGQQEALLKGLVGNSGIAEIVDSAVVEAMSMFDDRRGALEERKCGENADTDEEQEAIADIEELSGPTSSSLRATVATSASEPRVQPARATTSASQSRVQLPRAIVKDEPKPRQSVKAPTAAATGSGSGPVAQPVRAAQPVATPVTRLDGDVDQTEIEKEVKALKLVDTENHVNELVNLFRNPELCKLGLRVDELKAMTAAMVPLQKAASAACKAAIFSATSLKRRLSPIKSVEDRVNKAYTFSVRALKMITGWLAVKADPAVYAVNTERLCDDAPSAFETPLCFVSKLVRTQVVECFSCLEPDVEEARRWLDMRDGPLGLSGRVSPGDHKELNQAVIEASLLKVVPVSGRTIRTPDQIRSILAAILQVCASDVLPEVFSTACKSLKLIQMQRLM